MSTGNFLRIPSVNDDCFATRFGSENCFRIRRRERSVFEFEEAHDEGFFK